MSDQPSGADQVSPGESYVESEGLGLVDALRFLYQRRYGLAARFLIFSAVGIAIAAGMYLASSRYVEGTLGLYFQGIEKSEYPSGRKFSVEDFRSPGILSQALRDADIPQGGPSIRELGAHVNVAPVIPAEVQNRWRRQDRDGLRREEYAPNEFKISIDLAGLTNDRRVRLFHAIVDRYRQSIKSDQKSALSFIAPSLTSYDRLAASYDFWDIPGLFSETYRSLNRQLDTVIVAASHHQDPKYQLSFREIARDLDVWERTRLESLEALTYQGRLVRNRDLIIQRVRYRIGDLDIQIRQKKQEANEALHLLEVAGRPSALLAGQLTNKEGVPLIDTSALDRLVKSDYIGPVVQRISALQGEAQVLDAEKARLEGQLSWLPKAENIELRQLPAGYKELVELLSSDLGTIMEKYNRLLDDYLSETTTGLVVEAQPPTITRGGYSLTSMVLGILLGSALLSVFLLGAEHIFRRAREERLR